MSRTESGCGPYCGLNAMYGAQQARISFAWLEEQMNALKAVSLPAFETPDQRCAILSVGADALAPGRVVSIAPFTVLRSMQEPELKGSFKPGLLASQANRFDWMIDLPMHDAPAGSYPTLGEAQPGDERHAESILPAPRAAWNYRAPEVFQAQVLRLFEIVRSGARLVRLNGVSRIWGPPDNPALNQPQSHGVVHMFREILSECGSGALLAVDPEGNSADAAAWFGGGGEAHLVADPLMPSLLSRALDSGETEALVRWAAGLTVPALGAAWIHPLGLPERNPALAESSMLGRWLAALAIVLSLPGIPEIRLPAPTIDVQEKSPAFTGFYPVSLIEKNLVRMLKIRAACPAFHPFGPMIPVASGPGILSFLRVAPDGRSVVFCLQNLTAGDWPVNVDIASAGFPMDGWVNLLSQNTDLTVIKAFESLSPFETIWLRQDW